MIQRINFYVKTFRNGYSVPLYNIEPLWLDPIIGYSLSQYNSEQSIILFLQKLREKPKNSINYGNPGTLVFVDENFVKIDCSPAFSDLKVDVQIDEIIKLLEGYLEFIKTYESCQIPGVIPASKLDTWTCVPKEYVKPEWWEHQKDQKNGA